MYRIVAQRVNTDEPDQYCRAELPDEIPEIDPDPIVEDLPCRDPLRSPGHGQKIVPRKQFGPADDDEHEPETEGDADKPST